MVYAFICSATHLLKMLHLSSHGMNSSTHTPTVVVQVDFLGTAGHVTGENWANYSTIHMAENSYQPVIFPVGFSAHWVRLVNVYSSSIMTAYFHYT